MNIKFKFDVAFSFLKGDENLALAINDLIQDRYSTFVYSLFQAELAGRDGQEIFDEIFGKQSRLVVVLYRKGWGQTPWTRMEETAIKNRAFDSGYDFTLWIVLDDSGNPTYIPKTRLWYDIERWGNGGAASVIESKINELGGYIKEESTIDKMGRMNRELEFEKYRKNFICSREGVNEISIELNKLFDYLVELSKNINDQKGDIYVNVYRNGLGVRLDCNSLIMYVNLFDCYANTLEHSSLVVEYENGWQYGDQKAKKTLYDKFYFDVDRAQNRIWKNGLNEEFNTEKLANVIITELVKTKQEHIISLMRNI